MILLKRPNRYYFKIAKNIENLIFNSGFECMSKLFLRKMVREVIDPDLSHPICDGLLVNQVYPYMREQGWSIGVYDHLVYFMFKRSR